MSCCGDGKAEEPGQVEAIPSRVGCCVGGCAEGPGRETKRRNSVRVRRTVQVLFILVVCVIGIRFGIFVHSLAGSSMPVAYRPAGVEAFLPISSLMSAIYLLKTGLFSRVHPAGLVLFLLTIATAFAVRRGFCSWICPIGSISELLHISGKKVFGRNFAVPEWLDFPLRSLKYVLLGMFAYVILSMFVEALDAFIRSPYNRVADVKMYVFFANMSRVAAAVLIVLAVLSVLVKNFWCRYLCPYGALLGLVSMASPAAMRRDETKCIGCGACARACPNRIDVNKRQRVWSPECMACYGCADACPKPGALEMHIAPVRKPLTAVAYAAIIVLSFVLVTQTASAFGYWQTDTPPQVYRQFYGQIRAIGHPRTMSYGSEADTGGSTKTGFVNEHRNRVE